MVIGHKTLVPMITATPRNRSSLLSTLTLMGRVQKALMLRNIRTRFFGTGVGFLLALGWPLAHMGILLAISIAFGRLAPYGDSAVVFFATGLMPFMAFLYVSRYMMTSVQSTRPLLAFPVVKITDLLMAGAVLEVLSSACSLIVLVIVLESLGENLMPVDPAQAAYAMMVAVLFGLSFGILNSLLVMALPIWGMVSGLVGVLFYITSGIFFVPSALPAGIRYWLAFNPLLQTIEWMRSAYFEGYGAGMLDKAYAVEVPIVMLFLGLIIERTFRGRFLIKT